MNKTCFSNLQIQSNDLINYSLIICCDVHNTAQYLSQGKICITFSTDSVARWGSPRVSEDHDEVLYCLWYSVTETPPAHGHGAWTSGDLPIIFNTFITFYEWEKSYPKSLNKPCGKDAVIL